MGIVKMSQLTLVGLAREKHAVLSALSKLGAVEVREMETVPEEYRNEQQELATQLQQLQTQRQLLETILPQAREVLPYKKPLFTLKRSLSMREFLRYEDASVRQQVLDWAERFRDNRRELQENRSQQATLRIQIELLRPWIEALGSASPVHTPRIHRWLGRLANQAQFDQLQAYLQEVEPLALLTPLLARDPKDPVLVLLAAPASCQDTPLQLAQNKGFKPLQQKQTGLMPQEELQQATESLLRAEQEQKRLEDEAKLLAEHISSYEELSDFLQVQIEKKETATRVPVTGRMFALQGYIPTHLVKGTEKGLEDAFCVSVSTRPADRAEDYPILLHNNRVTRPYEAVTDMFSLPSASEVDPVPAVMPFYCLFFGMMFSDVAYGLILSLVTAILVWKVKVQGNFRKMCQVFFQCGLSSIVFGALFGGAFGNLIGEFGSKMLGNEAIVFKPIWFDPMEDPTRLMLWSVVFGTLHIFVGLAVKMHVLFATGKWQEALFDVAPWYPIITGLGLVGAGASSGNALYTEIGKWMAIFGAVVILLMAGRPSKNPIKRIFSGLGSLYGITGYFSDIMSYTRILALALSTAVIAMVVNLLSLLPGRSIFGFVFFLLVALLGHTLNFALSALSAYVHTTRLHYVEYFGKCLDGGGRAFTPLAYHTKYVLIDRPEDPKPETEALRKRFLRFRKAEE